MHAFLKERNNLSTLLSEEKEKSAKGYYDIEKEYKQRI